MKIDIGIIGAMEEEVSLLASSLSDSHIESFSGMNFYIGKLHGKHVAVVKCGIGKVFAAIAAEAMAIKYSPSLIINTGVGKSSIFIENANINRKVRGFREMPFWGQYAERRGERNGIKYE